MPFTDPKPFADPFLNRLVHRSDGGGFAIYLEEYLKTRAQHMTRGDVAVLERAAFLIEILVLDSHELEDRLGQSRAAHQAERGVSVRQELRIRDLEEEVEMLKGQVEVCRRILDSPDDMDEGTERQGGPLRGGGLR